MKKSVFKLVFVATLICFNGSAIADDKSIQEINNLLAEEKLELEQLKRQIERQGGKISSVGKKETSLLLTLHQMENKLKLKKRELEIYKWNIAINKKKVVKLNKNMKNIEKSLVRQKAALAMWLRTIYKVGGLYPIKVLFSADNITEMVQRMKYMEVVMENDALIFEEYTGRLESLNYEKQALLKVQSDLVRLQKDVGNKKSEIETERNTRVKFLKRLRKDQRLFVKVQKEYRQRSKSLNFLIQRLEKKLELGENLNFTDHKGRLKLPVKGKILNSFGKKKDKQYNIYIVQNGINIRTKKGTPVRAIYSGKVLYIGSLDGYGNMVILGHGEKYHSIYGHMNKILTRVGKNVQKGQILGKSGDSGSIIGEALYFELRQRGKAIEPTEWFRLAKS